jgi:hypothetical protein
MNAIDPYLFIGVSLGLTYLTVVALASFVFAVGDVAWTMKNSWAIAALQNPKRAALLAPEASRAPRRRAALYLFVTRNPVYDLCLAHSSFTRASIAAVAGFLVICLTGFLAYVWDDYLKAPTERLLFQLTFGGVLAFAAILCISCGWSSGLTISRFKQSQQWSAILATPLNLRTILLGICLPNLGDAAILCALLTPLLIAGCAVGMLEWTHVGLIFLLLTLAFLVCVATSIFSSAFTKNGAKAGVLCVVLTGFLAGKLAYGLNAWSTLFPRGPYPPQWWETWTPFIIALLYLFAFCGVLTWLGVRRLRWDR